MLKFPSTKLASGEANTKGRHAQHWCISVTRVMKLLLLECT